MREELRERILAYNKALAERKEKAEDLQVIVDGMQQLPYGQLKKLMTDEVLTILEKYGISDVQ